MDAYDKWKTTPPEYESLIKCDMCGNDFYPEDMLYEIDGDNLCEECAERWLKGRSRTVRQEECYGY